MPDPLLIWRDGRRVCGFSRVLTAMIGWPRRHGQSTWLTRGGSWASASGSSWAAGCWASGLTGLRARIWTGCWSWCSPPSLWSNCWRSFPRCRAGLSGRCDWHFVAGGARVLLHGTSYITDVTGPGTSEWSPSLAWLIFGGLAALEATVWALLSLLARRAPGPSLPICLAVASAGAAVTVMLSGYATGGQVGLPLAAALMGATAAALVLTRASRATGPLGVPIVGLFSLLVIGRFFGELTSVHAILFFCAPLLGWLPELPYLRRLPSWARGLARVILVGRGLGRRRSCTEKVRSRLSIPVGDAGSKEPSVQDYMNFGK